MVSSLVTIIMLMVMRWCLRMFTVAIIRNDTTIGSQSTRTLDMVEGNCETSGRPLNL